MAEMPDVVSGEIIESEWGNDIRDRTIQRYASVAERTSLNATPTVGDVSFLEDSGQVDIYYAGGWKPIHPERPVQQDVASGTVATTIAAVAGFNMTIPASWGTGTITAWGAVQTSGSANLFTHVTIGGVDGTQFSAAGPTTLMVGSRRTLGPGTYVVSLMARRTGDPITHQSVLTANLIRST